jgi:secretion/DNA translocation related TadE-like protein
VSENERGSITIVALGGVALAMALLIGVARVGAGAVLRARADNAADAAALAAADALASGRGAGAAARAAEVTAAQNGARLVSCDCDGDSAEVVVSIVPNPALRLPREVLGRARAEVDAEAAFAPP